jgi:hypothetical protein
MNWTPETDALLRKRFHDGLSYSRLGDLFGVTTNVIAGRCHRLGIRRPPKPPKVVEPEIIPPRPPEDQRDIDILSDIAEGHSLRQTADHWGVSYSYVQQLARAARAA